MEQDTKIANQSQLQAPVSLPAQVFLPCDWPYRMLGNAMILGVILFLASITVTIKTDLINKQLLSLQDSLMLAAGELGLVVDDVIVEGRKRTPVAVLNQAIGVKRGDNLLKLDLDAIRYNLEQLPWVRSAAVRRSFLPNVIQVALEEYSVKCLWQFNERFYPIGEDNNVIEVDDYVPDKPLLLIVGAGAPEHVNELLEAIDDGSDIFKRVKAANFISERRWDIILDDIERGITVKMPEKGIAEAWKKLHKLNESKNILKRKLTNIDLRLEGKVHVKLEKSGSNKATKLKSVKESRL